MECSDCGLMMDSKTNVHICQATKNTAWLEVKCLCPHHGEKRNKPCSEDDPKCPFHPSDEFFKRDGTLTSLGEALQSLCTRCGQQWMRHDCPTETNGNKVSHCDHNFEFGAFKTGFNVLVICSFCGECRLKEIL